MITPYIRGILIGKAEVHTPPNRRFELAPVKFSTPIHIMGRKDPSMAGQKPRGLSVPLIDMKRNG
jgi:hypothetical protein